MNEALFTANNLWILVATCLVFMMHLGFATLESGLVRRKNTVNILFKNCMIVAIGLLLYYFIGFGLMYPGKNPGGFFAFGGFGLHVPSGNPIDYAEGQYTYYTDFIFQAMFAATCATIVSGAVAERMKLESFLLISVLLLTLVYPIVGFWKWGGGWLDTLGFYDFAGSTLVHSVGGWCALAAAWLLGPRKGKYTKKGIMAIPGHNLPLAAIGVFLLWFGWFGFNGGSVLSADPTAVSLVFVTTALAGAAGAIGAFIASYLLFKSHDLSMVLNGILGGLVAITAGADVMGPTASILIGLIAGVVIPFSVLFFDNIKIDDPVGATSVHLVCGILGTLFVGMFGDMASWSQFMIQLQGVAAVGVYSFAMAYGIVWAVKKTIGIRVSFDEEHIGLDAAEHDVSAYNELIDSPEYGFAVE